MSAAAILIVEDSKEDLAFIERAFRKTGKDYRIIHFDSSAEAKAFLAAEEIYADRAKHPLPDMLLLDSGIPGSGQMEIARWIRTVHGFDHLPLAIMSGAPKLMKKRCEGLNCCACIDKMQFIEEPQTFVRTIEDCLQGKTTD